MFCEKCGANIPEGSKFCIKCGNPVAPEEQPVQQPVQQNFQQPYQQPEQQNFQQPYQQPAPKAPRQPLPEKTKKLILFGGIGAGVIIVALIVLFAVVIPSLNKVDVSQYLETSFNSSDTIYDGEISGSVSVSADRLYIDKLGDADTKKLLEDQKKIKEGNISYSDLLDSANSSIDKSTKLSAVSSIVSSLEVSCEIKDAEDKKDADDKKNSDSESTSASSDSRNYARFENAKSDDVLVVKIAWPKDAIDIKEIEQKEQLAGISFDKSDKTVEIKLDDKIKEKKLEVTEKVNVDFIKYLNDKKLIKIKGLPGNNPTAYLKEFEFTEGDYTLTNKSEDDSSSTTTIYVTNSKDKDKKGQFYVSFDSVSEASSGDEIEFHVSSGTEHISGTDVFLKETEGKFTYTPNKALTVNEAKTNSDKISKHLTDNIKKIDSSITDAKNFEIAEMYYIVQNDETDEEAEIYVFYKNTGNGKYKYITMSRCYINDGEFFAGSEYSSWSNYDSVADSQKYMNPFYESTKKNYTTTKIM